MAKPRKAVLVLPDLGLDEKQLDDFKYDFQNHIVGTLRRAAPQRDEVVVVVVVVVVAEV